MAEVRLVKNQEELNDLLYQRWLVLRAPLGMAQGTETDGHEEGACHLVAVSDSQIIGSARLRLLSEDLGSIAFVAVLPEFRNQGIGTKLMEQLIKIGIEKNLQILRLKSRINAINFYERLGFVAEGEFFDYLGIPHIFMSYKLQASSRQVRG
ncbi:GNAT family N-acetyltransferase [Aetokthonos hydrillicola Thurmond2011]|jgi:ribosomal protein S18 acetylase RimI-like enzyme|uniref:GNAT family N-acetyltransferase n=1 Tax=Aetokthonos hydrillicola Thurmond2011 TaxID=2712845 RepID=A0AAP5M6N8_9CYAN|nr:GNAT family N-acetyltransferase [Aetokthonos hydrillicola]MBO3457839.1 GNAT family N-acetyltransferase [Aetokthonos hydrillicola CCALA 1050]MBW4588303.1 GNAT family N-acetyltransferase [Aetokthonos hydrillicola CCALA 1050]MDR9897216.1 GNAT family N-acetyltransferase [Aetokthonos hydrillicola Thurmond2011]